MKSSINEEAINWFLEHGVERIFPEDEGLRKKLMSGEPIKAYLGMDATGKLHLGHALMLRKLGELQKLGHHVIVLIGGFTSLIGDPTDKTSARKQQTREEVEEHAKNYLPLISKFIDITKATIRNNADWYSEMTFAKVIEIASHFTVQQMLERDMFQRRMYGVITCPDANCKNVFNSKVKLDYDLWPGAKINQLGVDEIYGLNFFNQECTKCKKVIFKVLQENTKNGKGNSIDERLDNVFNEFAAGLERVKPIYLHEFFYPLMQGYDSVMLDVDLEIGGNDQTFNMLAGRDLVKDYSNGKKTKYVMAHKLLVDASGKKMGKTDGNGINLDDSPADVFGKIMSWPDEMIMPAFELLTDLKREDLDKRRVALNNSNPIKHKIELATIVTTWLHSENEANVALVNFANVHQKHEKPNDIPVIEVKKGSYSIIELLVLSGLCTSKTDARTQVNQGAIKVKDVKVEPGSLATELLLNINEDGAVIQKGKRHFVHVKGV